MKSIKIITLLALLLIGPAEASEIINKPADDWLTYRSSSFGFSFRYPETLAANTRNADSFNIEGLVLCVELVDKNNPDITALRIMVSEPSNNPSALKKDSFSLRKKCKKYKELIIGGRKAVNCVTCSKGACSWKIVFPGARQLEVLTMLKDEIEQTGPEDRTYPLLSIINSLKFRASNKEFYKKFHKQ
jgi:hypothetical protein